MCSPRPQIVPFSQVSRCSKVVHAKELEGLIDRDHCDGSFTPCLRVIGQTICQLIEHISQRHKKESQVSDGAISLCF